MSLLHTASGRSRLLLAGIAAAALLLTAGCGQDVEIRYGERGGLGWDSVAGTSVLGSMFENHGYKVRSLRYLSPKTMNTAHTIVWFPDDYTGPSKELRDWFDEWLAMSDDRTLIYVGRDFDAESQYWDSVQGSTPPRELPDVKRRLGLARGRYLTERMKIPADADYDWFRTSKKPPPRKVTTLGGDPRLVQGINPAKVEIELNTRYIASPNAEVLLESNGEPLVTIEERRESSQVIVVTNGSFLLNEPLVNHEHRKLAGRLIDLIPPTGEAIFLESESGGPPILKKEPREAMITGLEAFGTPPFDMILLHLAVLGLLFSLSRYPIFGMARRIITVRPSDFGRHVVAFGELLQKSGDAGYAQARLAQYRHQLKPEARPRPKPVAAPKIVIQPTDLPGAAPAAVEPAAPIRIEIPAAPVERSGPQLE